MADTNFVDGTTLTAAEWFNDLNRLHYTIFADAANAAAALDAISVLTTIGDSVVATTAGADARLAAAADVAAHATTSNIWGAREITLTGGAVTFTDIADAPYVGAVAWVKQNAAHVWDDGAVFDVQGGADYTAAAGDWIRVYATTVSTFEVTIFKADGTAVAGGSAASTTAAGIVELLTQAEYDAATDTTRAPTASLNRIALAAEQATTSGTAWDFTGIPSGTRWIGVHFKSFSTNAVSIPLIQLGDAGGPENSGYLGGFVDYSTCVNFTTGFGLASGWGAGAIGHGSIFLTLENAATFSWCVSGSLGRSDSAVGGSAFGSKSLSAELDRVRVTTVNGTDAGDGGAVSITYGR